MEAPATPCYDDVWRDAYGDMQEHGPAHRHMRRLLAEILRGLEYESVVDVGCGAGDNLSLLCEGRTVRRVAGVDVSEEALARARRRTAAEYTRLDIQTDRLPDRFDLVFSSLVLEHLPHDGAALANMCAMTGRHLLVTTIAGNFERYRAWDEQMGHVRNYRRGELERKLHAAGFVVERVHYWGFPFYSPLARLLQNRMTAKPRYGRVGRALAAAMHVLFYANSRRRGDLLIALARPSTAHG